MSNAVSNPEYKPIPHPATPYKTFKSFYPFYLGEHSKRSTRILHLTGTSVAIVLYSRAILSGIGSAYLNYAHGYGYGNGGLSEIARRVEVPGNGVLKLCLVALGQGYFLAWLSHFFLEKNKPATFKYPLFSLRGDFKLLWEVLTLQRAL